MFSSAANLIFNAPKVINTVDDFHRNKPPYYILHYDTATKPINNKRHNWRQTS